MSKQAIDFKKASKVGIKQAKACDQDILREFWSWWKIWYRQYLIFVSYNILIFNINISFNNLHGYFGNKQIVLDNTI